MTDVQRRRRGRDRDDHPSSAPAPLLPTQRRPPGHARAPLHVHPPPPDDGDEQRRNVIDVDGDVNDDRDDELAAAAHAHAHGGASSSRPSDATTTGTEKRMIRIPFRPDPGTYTREWLLGGMQSASVSTSSARNREAIPHTIERELARTLRNSHELFLGGSTSAEDVMSEVLAQPPGSCAFLTVLPHDPPTVVVAHSLGRYATAGSLGDPRDRQRNRIVALVGEREGAVPWSSSLPGRDAPRIPEEAAMMSDHRLDAAMAGSSLSAAVPTSPPGLSLPSLFLAPRGTSEESVAEHLFGLNTYRVLPEEMEDDGDGDGDGGRSEDGLDEDDDDMDLLRTPPPPTDELYGDVEVDCYHSPAPSCEEEVGRDQQIEEIRTARLMHLPPCWAVHFLGGMGPGRALRIARALIKRDLPTPSLAKDAMPLMEWLRVACQRESAASDRSAVSVDWAPVLSTNQKVRGWADSDRVDPFLRQAGVAEGRGRTMGSSELFGGSFPPMMMTGRTSFPPPPPRMPLPPPPMVPWTFPPSGGYVDGPDDDDDHHHRTLQRSFPPEPTSEETSASASASASATASASAMVSPSPIHSSSAPPAPEVALSGPQVWRGGGGGGATTVKEEFRGEARAAAAAAEAEAEAETDPNGGAEVPRGGAADGDGSDMDVGSDYDYGEGEGGRGGVGVGAAVDDASPPDDSSEPVAVAGGATEPTEGGGGGGGEGQDVDAGTAATSDKAKDGPHASGGGGLGGRWRPDTGGGPAADSTMDRGVSKSSSSTATDRQSTKAAVDGDDRDGAGRSKQSGRKRSHEDRGERDGHGRGRGDHRADDGSHRHKRSSRGDDERGGGGKNFSYASLGDRSHPPARRSAQRDRGHHEGGGWDDGWGRRDGHDYGHGSGWEWSRQQQHQHQNQHGYGWDETHGGLWSRQQQYAGDGGGWTQRWGGRRSDEDGWRRPPPSSRPPPPSSKGMPTPRRRGGGEGCDGDGDGDGVFTGSLALREMGPFPDRLVGCLIGKGGVIVKSLVRESRCKIHVDPDSMIVRVMGHSQREVDRALRMVRDRCDENNNCH